MKPSILPALAMAFSMLMPQGKAQQAALPAPAIELTSRGPGGVQGDSYSGAAALSATGRFVAFHSYSANLAPEDTNGHWDVFVRDRVTGAIERVSVGSLGQEANSASSYPSISADGRFVAFVSIASNLVPGDVNGEQDVFVHDRLTGVTVLASRSTEGVQGNGRSELATLSDDGRYVAFQSFASTLAPDPNGSSRDAFVHDLATGVTTLVSVGHVGQAATEEIDGTTLSGDGLSVAFQTKADNLVPGDTNGVSDVFVSQWLAGTIARVSLDSGGGQSNGYSAGPSLSRDGRLVAFESSAALVPEDLDPNVRDVYLHDLSTGRTSGVSVADPSFGDDHVITDPSISADGSRIAFQAVVFVYPFFETFHVHVMDRRSGVRSTLLSQRRGALANGDSTAPSISATGSIVAFESFATNLVTPDGNNTSDVFVQAFPGESVEASGLEPREIPLRR